jgi:16S rRNA C967 or C1407 C5-methylase (RsmB/RsmF family)
MKYIIPEWLKKIFQETFGSNFEDVLLSLTKPPKKYYLRVNTTKISVKELIKRIQEEEIEVKQDEIIEEAVYIEGYKENGLINHYKYVVAKLDAAESTAVGADLYRAGVLSIKNANKDNLVNVVTQDYAIASEGVLVIEPKDLNNIQRGLVVKNIKPKFKLPSIRSLKAFNEGLIYPQTYPSILTVKELEPKENETILDMCAAPGGKLSHIISLTKGKAKIIAVDKSNNKVRKIKETLQTLGLPLPILIKNDARNIGEIFGSEFADKILLDPSCSDLGLRPRITFNIPERDPKIYGKYQKSLIRKAYEYLKKEGILVYSVCTISKEETLDVFNYAVEELKMEPLEINYKVGDIKNNYIEIFNPLNHDTVGYAIFKLKKVT